MDAFSLEQVRLTRARRAILEGLDLRAREGEFTFVLGRSGSGKTTLLRVLAGLIAPDAGVVRLFDDVASDPRVRIPPERRPVGMVFQHDALWPHFTVAGHLRFVLGRSLPRAARDAEIERLLDLVRLRGMDDRLPATLSGGERQRLSLARALARRPRLLLMDEPTRNLDRPLARAVRAEFARVAHAAGASVLYVTHDPEEAFALADRIVVLDEGRIVADGAPEALYRTPPDARTARLLGLTPAVEGVVDADGRAGTPLGPFPTALPPGARFAAFFRPEDLELVDGSGTPARLRRSRFHGSFRELDLEVDGAELRMRVGGEVDPPAGSTLRIAARRAPLLVPEVAS